MKIKKFFSYLVLFFSVSKLLGQPLSEYNFFKEKYPTSDAIYKNWQASIEIKLVNEKPIAFYTTSEEFFYLTDFNSSYNNRSIYYSGFYELIDKEVSISINQKNKYKKIEVTNFKTTDFNNNNIFFDDSKQLKFMFDKISKGDKTKIDVNYKINDIHFLPKFTISPYYDYENISFTVKVPANFELGVDTFIRNGILLNHTITRKGNFIIHSWTGSSKKTLDYKSDGPDEDYLSSQIHCRVKTYTYNNEIIPVLRDVKDLYNWNFKHAKQSEEDFMKFKPLTDSIIGGEKDHLKIASKIFYWVQNNIRYIAFEAGYEGYIPAKASVVCKERYGDCKGMANILYNFLKSQNLDAHLVWIGTRDIPYKYSELPLPCVDNHMIAAIKHNGEYIFLDATSNNLKFGLPSPFIQGKEALISLGKEDNFEIVTVPEISESENVFLDSCYLKISNKDVLGSGVSSLYGYNRMVFLDGLTELDYQSKLNHCRDYLLKGSNRFFLDTIWFTNFDDKDLPLMINYKFNIPDYLLKVENEVYFNLNLDKINIPEKIEVTRNIPVEYKFKNKMQLIVCIEKPANLTSIDFTESVTSDNKTTTNFYFENRFVNNKNYLVKNSIYIRKPLFIQPNQFSEFNSLIESMQKNYSQQITFKLK